VEGGLGFHEVQDKKKETLRGRNMEEERENKDWKFVRIVKKGEGGGFLKRNYVIGGRGMTGKTEARRLFLL